jgi:hypothetical protein
MIVAGSTLPEGVEGLVFRGPTRDTVPARDRVDGVDLQATDIVRIGHHLILVAALVEADRTRALREQVDNRRAAQTKRVLRDPLNEDTVRLGVKVHEEDYFHLVAEASPVQVLPAGEVDEPKLVREGEELGEQPVTEEGLGRVRMGLLSRSGQRERAGTPHEWCG